MEESQLLDVLNRWPKEPACVRLALIIELIKRVDSSFALLRALADPERQRREDVSSLEQLNKLLTRYPRIPALALLGDGHLRREWIDCNAKNKGDQWEAQMAHWLIGLASSNLFSRVRHCRDCFKWFYARTDHQRFCSESCRKKFSASSPAFKERRARYMREKYRPLQKQLEERAKRKRG